MRTNAIYASGHARAYIKALLRLESDRLMPREWKQALLNHVNSVEAFERCIEAAIEAAAKNSAA